MRTKLLAVLFLCAGFGFGAACASTGALVPADSPEAVRPLGVGQALPAAEVIGADGRTVSLASLVADKPTILIFYRGGWCPFCNAHLAALAEIELDLRKLGFQIIGITPDSADKLAATAKETKARYRLVSDRAMQAAGAMGVAFRLSAEAGARYQGNGIDVPPAPDGQGFWQPVPAAFIVSRDGVVRFTYHDADPANPANPQTLVTEAAAIARL